MVRTLLGITLALFALAARADMYRWVDKQGNVHYSDRAPPIDAKESKAMKAARAGTAPVAATQAPAKQKTYAEMEADFKKRRVEKQEAEVKKEKELAEAAEKARNCERARNHHKSLEAGGRFTKSGSDGEQLDMNDDDIAKAKVDAQKSVSEWCKG